jgi:nicotinic acid phosphoribosyltransferase
LVIPNVVTVGKLDAAMAAAARTMFSSALLPTARLLVTWLQGDGINVVTIGKILDAAVAAGFSAENVAFGMGGGLLQRVNRCGAKRLFPELLEAAVLCTVF